MEKHIEKEYKVLLSKEQFYKLLEEYSDIVFHTQINHYYDTIHHDIMNFHGAMRIREKNGSFTFTLKKLENNNLLEYECSVQKNDTSVFQLPEIQKVLDHYQIHGPFIPTTSLKTQRGMFINDDAELCFDINEYNGNIDYEIEYEYLKEHDGLFAFQSILNKIGVTYESNAPSKISRVLKSRS